MKTKAFGIVSLFCFVVAVLWLVLMILSLARTGPIDNLEQALNSVASPDWLYYLSYTNAVIITISATILFAGLYLYCRETHRELSIVGLLFIPVYCGLNLASYFSQITIVPELISRQAVADYDIPSRILVGQIIQGWPGSAVSTINNFAYAILGISSFAFALALLKKGRLARISGVFLMLNAVACIAGIIGIAAGNKTVGMGSMFGGMLFIVALVFLTLMFYKEAGQ